MHIKTALQNLLITVVACFVINTGAYAQEFMVVVNTANTFAGSNAEAIEQVRQLYLKNKANWQDGTKAKPLGPKNGTAPYKAFLGSILNMSDADLAQHWLRTKQISGQTPPNEIKSARILVKMVAKDAGAFAAVTTDTQLPTGVKKLFSF